MMLIDCPRQGKVTRGCTLDIGPREQRLLQLLLSGHTIRAAAGQLHISSRTTEAMLAELRERVDAPSLYALGAIAERLGWHEHVREHI